VIPLSACGRPQRRTGISAHIGRLALLAACVGLTFAGGKRDLPAQADDLVSPLELRSIRACLDAVGAKNSLPILAEIDSVESEDVFDALAHRYRYVEISAILVCARLVGAWRRYAFAQGTDPTHNILVITLQNPDGSKGTLDANTISRVLGIPNLLPPAFNGGVLFRDAVVLGPLVLNQINVQLPVTFTAMRFTNGPYPRDAFNLSPREFAITAFGSEFQKRIIFSDTELCGKLHIANAQFRESLYVLTMKQLTENCQEIGFNMNKDDIPSVDIQRSNFTIGVWFFNPNVGWLTLDTNNLGHLVLFSGHVEGLKVTDNTLNSLNANGLASDKLTQIGWNNVQGSMYISNLQNGTKGAPEPQVLQAFSNRVGGGFYALNVDNPSLHTKLDFSHNSVQGNSQITLENSWRGELDLSSTRFEAGLQIGLQRGEEWLIEDARLNGTYCVENDAPLMKIRLDWVEVKGLDWTFPISCNVRWSGEGLSYGRWNGDSFKDDRDKSLIAWRTTLSVPNSDPLLAMSRYLSSHGKFLESRGIMIETKRLDYTDCAPHRRAFECLLKPLFSADDLLSGIVRTLVFWFMIPGGYGAQPERAMVCVIAGVFAFYFLYRAYSEVRRRAHQRTVRSIENHLAVLGRVPAVEVERADIKSVEELERDFRRILDFHLRSTNVKPGAENVEEQNQRIQAFAKDLDLISKRLGVEPPELDTECLYPRYTGDSKTFGFSHFDVKIKPSKFTYFRYSLDTMLPVVYLHTYTNYYPESTWVRALAIIQHLLGWWWVTVFLASVALL